LGTSFVNEFHKAIGQFINYRYALQKKEPARVLYLAIPDETYRKYFVVPFVQEIIANNQIKLLVYEIETEEIVQWIDSHNTVLI